MSLTAEKENVNLSVKDPIIYKGEISYFECAVDIPKGNGRTLGC